MKIIYNFFVSIPIFASLIICIIFSGFGVYDTVLAISAIFKGLIHTNENIAIKLIDALDLFLISFLFLIFALGFSQLFMAKSKLSEALENLTPKWLQVENFTELKLILWETVLTSMVIIFVAALLKNAGNFKWEMVIYPIGIVLISLSGYFIRKGEKIIKKVDDVQKE